ncbi:hypothetical protein [Nonlabens antarcticus]|uniref:hypothetical protein n=1 Tax=Nonlabens antarcticus TaxID=392714 RepID=UPI001891299A|nr:hypothetical protein [Nonlabens antarcticus]
MFAEYQDYIYVAAVILAFFIFLGWNKSRQRSVKDRKRRNFKNSVRQKRARRDKDSKF